VSPEDSFTIVLDKEIILYHTLVPKAKLVLNFVSPEDFFTFVLDQEIVFYHTLLLKAKLSLTSCHLKIPFP